MRTKFIGSDAKTLNLLTDNIMKEYLKAIFALFFFRPYTIYSRWFEIALGVSAWFQLFVVLFGIYKIINR